MTKPNKLMGFLQCCYYKKRQKFSPSLEEKNIYKRMNLLHDCSSLNALVKRCFKNNTFSNNHNSNDHNDSNTNNNSTNDKNNNDSNMQ